MASSSSADPLGVNRFLAGYSHDEDRHQRMALGLGSPSRFADDVHGTESLVEIQSRMLFSHRPPASVKSYPSQRTLSTAPSSTDPSQIFTEFSNSSTGFSVASSATHPAGFPPFPELANQNLNGVLFCEFVGLGGCDASFHPHEFWPWVAHIEEEHLQQQLPESCRCWFCDDVKFKVLHTNDDRRDDRRDNFCHRMEHIHRHIVHGGCTVQQMRPDFDILKHLHWHNLVDDTVYRWARQYEEGPTAPGTYAYDFMPPEQLEAAQRGQRVELKETRKEQREWRARQQGRQLASRHGRS